MLKFFSYTKDLGALTPRCGLPELRLDRFLFLPAVLLFVSPCSFVYLKKSLS